MKFAFYKSSGLLHDIGAEIDETRENPATGEMYTQEELENLNILDFETEVLPDLKLCEYLFKNYFEDFKEAQEEVRESRYGKI